MTAARKVWLLTDAEALHVAAMTRPYTGQSALELMAYSESIMLVPRVRPNTDMKGIYALHPECVTHNYRQLYDLHVAPTSRFPANALCIKCNELLGDIRDGKTGTLHPEL